jgi:membrane protein
MTRLKALFHHVQAFIRECLDDHIFQLSAALAYYSLFSLGPLLVVFIGTTGLLLGPEAVQGQLEEKITGMLGPSRAETIQSMVQSISNREQNAWATLLGTLALVVGATGVFGQLQYALNQVWDVEAPKTGGLLGFVRARFLSFAMVMGCSFLLLVSLVVSAVLENLSRRLEAFFTPPAELFLGLHFALSFFIITVLFAMIFKYLPDTPVAWREVWMGAATTALFFMGGEFLLGLYLGREGARSAYGNAGAVVGILMWVYYASVILLLGAELTQVYSRRARKK